jgi:arsenate reductase
VYGSEKLKIYGIKTCDACRKARKAFPQAEFVDLRETPLSQAEISSFFETFGDQLLNRKSTTWRGLSAEEQRKDPIELLGLHPTLTKRPIIVADAARYLGWTAQVQAALL